MKIDFVRFDSRRPHDEMARVPIGAVVTYEHFARDFRAGLESHETLSLPLLGSRVCHDFSIVMFSSTNTQR
ncbi:hypothetical protein EJ06DRAFT_324189 [Trichodelitschia bisporula]|uniref:Uncharacterized protein n=1 Tax=Trichodelitschia bisporula TaxID=703511 RepID=A0A6G1I4M4_9PEZI|nr:hypothetical protein EJ06DRAFT_324189 [Trichodelitschia bisporula]